MSDFTSDELEHADDADDADDASDDDGGTGAGGDGGSGAISRNVLTYVAKAIVDDPDSVVIHAEDDRRGITLRLHVAPDDMGKVIGRRGRVAQAIRTVVRAAGARERIEASVDIVD
jgi:predicted RNA-binding protein YlqC (UPF0109 family)